MGSNSFGHLFRITTWGESHGKGIGVVIDGCPAGLELTEEDVNAELEKRRGNQTPFTTARSEKDKAIIYSGTFEGKTTGCPISMMIQNGDADPSKYRPIKNLLRPGHSHFTYLEKYGVFDYYGGGRSSARETACRVAAGAVAKKILSHFGVNIVAYISEIGGIRIDQIDHLDLSKIREKREASPILCPDKSAAKVMMSAILKTKEDQDSLGGIIECIATNVPAGLGDPIYEKLEANLAKAMMTLPATKGFEIGSGFEGARMKGSEHNDPFTSDDQGSISTTTNFAGGTLGGISTGMPILFRVAFKPTSGIRKRQTTVDLKGNLKTFKLPEGSRHDPCLAIRAVSIVETMASLVLTDALLLNRVSRL